MLGVVFDNSLSFSSHINYIAKRVAPKIALLNRLRHIIDTESLNTVYIATVQSIFDYCLTVWGSCSQVHIDKLQRLQNRAARAVLGDFDYYHSVSAMIKQLGWMNMKQRHLYFTCIFMF